MADAAEMLELLPVFPLPMVDEDDEDQAYRLLCRELVRLGVDKQVLSAQADLDPSWAGKFMSGQIKTLKTRAARKLDRYFEELAQLLDGRPRRVRHAKEPPGRESDSKAS